MFKIGHFTCQDKLQFWNATLLLLNCYHVVLRSDFEKALTNENKTCSDKCAEFDADRVT